MVSPLLPRPQYRHSGQVDWPKFIPLALAALAVSSILAVVLHCLFVAGWYLIVLVPVTAAALNGGMVYLAVRHGHCRNPVIGVSLGVLCGLLLYGGYYYVGMIKLGHVSAHRIDLLPRYISLVMETMKTHDVAGPKFKEPLEPNTLNTIKNWFGFAIELCSVFALEVLFAAPPAPYCETCRKWLKKNRAVFAIGTGSALTEAFETGHVSKIAQIPRVTIYPNTKYTVLDVDTCEAGGATSCPTYLTVRDVSSYKNGDLPERMTMFSRNVYLRRIQLEPDEITALGGLF